MKAIITSIFFVASTITGAAQCRTSHVPLKHELKSSGETIVATVEGAQSTPGSSFHMDGVNYSIKVDKVLEGHMLQHDSVTVFSENSPAVFPMQVGKQYLLFVHLDYNRYEVDNCGNSGELVATRINNVRDLRNYAKQ